MAFGAIYEVLGDGLGTHGDEWHAQKTAFLGFIGATITMLPTWMCTRSRAHPV